MRYEIYLRIQGLARTTVQVHDNSGMWKGHNGCTNLPVASRKICWLGVSLGHLPGALARWARHRLREGGRHSNKGRQGKGCQPTVTDKICGAPSTSRCHTQDAGPNEAQQKQLPKGPARPGQQVLGAFHDGIGDESRTADRCSSVKEAGFAFALGSPAMAIWYPACPELSPEAQNVLQGGSVELCAR